MYNMTPKEKAIELFEKLNPFWQEVKLNKK